MSIKTKFKRWFFQDMPQEATWDEWRDWEDKARKKKVRWFLADTFPFWCWKTFINPFEKAKSWLRYRTVDRYHTIKTTLKPGYYDMDTRLLYAMFDMLVDFVELEKAWMNVVFTKRKPWSGWGRTHWWRSRIEGLSYLEWEIGLGDPNLPEEERHEQQAKNAQEIKYLYTWWKDVRPNRPDPAKVSGWDNVCDKWNILSDKDNFEEKKSEVDAALKKQDEIEKEYEDEDTRMMKRLIDVRKALWT
ncbi:MAG: hypothetical protein GTO45_37895 [Candidatus Aminicenantes bacterium]|nr:hypothetical protein [Candidatus Aminicenantes bacterium]NIM80478.1 hypothetical protein [Candidatus Aminicenantes bacterium]NIN23918.1 hypothetical protein [Candidatus Aminicenantes bacterium]NIN47633.1 hypothetical protein [Candidatus Aminicenantes bacterium]NIN90563.1 hypothetical protein [Candidatus Aminicenantes bacterium]